MSTASMKGPETPYRHLIDQTFRACDVARQAAATSAEGIATGSVERFDALRALEKELDTLDHEVDEGVTLAITQVSEAEARELLACMKFVIGLERIGDLLLSFGNSARAVCARIDPTDIKDLTMMASMLEKMLGDVSEAFSTRDMKEAITVLRMDAGMDRLRNLIFLRHIENPEGVPLHESFQVLFMTQSLERAGDHVKNLAEEVCHFISGHTVRHVLRSYDRPMEQMFIEWMRDRQK